MFLDPEEVLRHLPIKAGMRIGDFGAGAGDYSLALAGRVPDGAVYAFDALPQHVSSLGRRGSANLYPLLADLNVRIPLKDALLDAGIVANILHALSERAQFVTELKRVLKPRAPILVIDWAASFNNLGPREEDVVVPGEAVRLFADQGFRIGAMLPAGSHHYAFIAAPQ